jgi:hypothetical protein
MSSGCHMFTYWSSPTTSKNKWSLTQRTESRMFIYSSLQKFTLFQQRFTYNTSVFLRHLYSVKKSITHSLNIFQTVVKMKAYKCY